MVSLASEMDPLDSFPGCMGRMINMFDDGTSITRTKMVTERPHRDVMRNCADIPNEPIDPVGAKMEGKHIASKDRSSPNKKPSGTPIKMLMSQEMLGDIEFGQKPPSVVARLMGLDSLPMQQPVLVDQNVRNKGHLFDDLAELQPHRQKEVDCFDKFMVCDSQSFIHGETFKDVYEVQQPPQKSVWIEKQSLQKERFDDNSYQRRMSLVRQKFNEAKLLATNEEFIDSKEFQDAVEVLNSNRDLFLKFLEESNPLFTKHLIELQSVPIPAQKTRITVLKPSSTTVKKIDKHIERQLLTDSVESIRKDNNHHYWTRELLQPKGQNLSQSTRIVVLKPCRERTDCVMTKLPNNLPKLTDGPLSGEAMANGELTGSREIDKGIVHQLQESLSYNKEDVFLSSVLSNGYIGDESSFNQSESEYMEDDIGSTSDMENATPATEHSCSCMHNIYSPISAPSFTRVSHSPESSVTREAKKRLSERLALVASSDNCHEPSELCRTSSTLGEMLAISELKIERSKDGLALSRSKSSKEENDTMISSAFLSSSGSKNDENLHGSLSRSKSVPLSPSACEVDMLNGEISGPLLGKPIVQIEGPKTNNRRSSFKDMVSSFFFSRSKRSSRGKSFRSASVQDERVQLQSFSSNSKLNDDFSESFEETPSAEIIQCTENLHDESTEGIFHKGVDSLEKPEIMGNCNQSCFSQTLAADDINNTMSQFCANAISGRPQALSRSPPIESVPRSLMRSSPYIDVASVKPLMPSMIISKADEEYDQFVFVRKLIQSSGLENKKSMIFGRWHSLDSPLNPSLLYDSLHMDDEEAKRTVSHRLLFDAVNEALLDISQSTLFAACHGHHKFDVMGVSTSGEVWTTLRNRLSDEKRVPSEPISSSTVVEWIVKNEVTGTAWIESKWLEICEFCKDIAGKVLEDLIEEAL
ncbi:uncharacterized protein LOC122028780 isoform X1 [Zingiber officinale]|uniref:DUF3741 domain-containing protein n=1 Tax=Zingiber officinale TaxID=94328 RepID=A0A8J5C7U0_ZINOF|nr:uncharacterized protein LOC122028780 isoform X1 [Zingiber officinale]XP_042443602.1 uncharacterized protein LOC122028780 isoform X1 [Zingiber officinale]KAG6472968.1 hypothetical protein ZIOFF_070448 [Zingiber officinale]